MTSPARPRSVPDADAAPARSAPFGWRDAPLLAEALATLARASAAIAILPFAHVATLASARPVRARGDHDPREVDRAVRAVRAWARRAPWRTVCFQQGLAVHLMLRRRGIASRLHYGVSQGLEKGLGAHVWVGVGDRVVIGGEEAGRFARLASYPADG